MDTSAGKYGIQNPSSIRADARGNYVFLPEPGNDDLATPCDGETDDNKDCKDKSTSNPQGSVREKLVLPERVRTMLRHRPNSRYHLREPGTRRD